MYEKLRTDGEILEHIAPLVIKRRYLHNHDYVPTEQLAQVGMRTPGEMRVARREAWKQGIAAGVQQGLFGLGTLEDNQPVCRYFEETPPVELVSGEIIIRADICRKQREAAARPVYKPAVATGTASVAESSIGGAPAAPGAVAPPAPPPEEGARRERLRLRFTVPKGKVSGLMGVMNLLQHRFDRLEIALTAESGEMSEREYEDQVREAFRQLGIEVEEEL